MSTDLEPRTSSKLDAFVDKRIGQVQERIRRLDILRSLLCVGVTVLSYGLLMAALDIALQTNYPGLVDGLHLASFVLFLGVAGFFFVQALGRLSRRINPYFAAKHLEETVPQAKNSVISWLDLREEKLPAAIRGAVSQKAAKDLKKTDSDKAVNPRANWLLFSFLGVLLVGFLVLLATRPNQFSSLMQRAYAPFQGIGVDSQTRITIVRPEKGNLIVAPDRNVEIRARITGSYPGLNQPRAPRLLFRYQQADPFVKIPLAEDTDGTWTILRKPDQVRTGFYYKVAAGDAETEEYEVIARTDPAPVRFDVTYKHRPYLRLKDEKVSFPNEKLREPRLQAKRGTEITLTVQTNRKLKEGKIQLEAGGEKLTFDGKVLEDATSYQTHWLLEKSGTFRVLFTSINDEPNSSAALYTVIVDDDKAPNVVITEPGKDISLPANGTLQLAGSASDDVGVRNLTLRLKALEGGPKTELAGKAFREGKDFKFDDGGYPDKVEYKDFVALDAIKTAEGKAYPLKEKMVLEYWLEARDNSDYPHKDGNLGVSKSYKVTILAPTKDEKKQKDERDKTAQKQKDFEKEQDKKHAENSKERSKEGKSPEPKEGPGKDSEADAHKKKGEDLAKAIEDAKKEKNPGEAKGDESSSPESKSGESAKGGAEAKSKETKGDPKEKLGADKSEGKDSKDKGAAAEAKGDGGEDKKGDAEPRPGSARDAGKEPPDAGAKGSDPKNGDKGSPKAGGEKTGPKDAPAQAKEEGGKSADGPPGKSKDEPASKEGGAKAKSGDPAGKEAPSPSAKSDPKGKDAGGPPTASKEPPSKGPDTAKEKGSGDGKIDPSSVKPGDHAKTDAPSTSKGSEDAGPKSAAKTPGKNDKTASPPDASAKAGKEGMDKTMTGASSKDGKSKDKSERSFARDDGRKDQPKTKEPKEATPEEVAKLRELLKDKDRAEQAAEELSKIAEDAKDAKTKAAAEKSLKEDGREAREPGRTKPFEDKKKGPDETGSAKGAGTPDSKKGPANARDSKPGEDTSSAKGTPDKKDFDPKKELDPKTESAKGTSKVGDRKPLTNDPSEDDLKAIKAVEEFLKRGGDLQLDDLARYLKNANADTVERAGWNKKELDNWLKAAAAHDERLAKDRTTTPARKGDTVKGNTGVLPSFGPTGVGTSTHPASDPLVGTRPQPPPEFREPQRIFTGRPKE